MGFKFVWAEHGPYLRFAESVTDEDLRDAAHLVMAQPAFDRMHYKVLDFQSVDGLMLSRGPGEIARELGAGAAGWFQASQRPIAVVFVGGHSDLPPLARAYDEILQEFNCLWVCRHFQCMRPAFTWVAHQCRRPVTLGTRIHWQDYGRYLAPRHRLIRCG